MIYANRLLSQKLELTEARANVDFVATRAKTMPESGAAWREVAGAYAMFDGVQSPLTQTFGLGVEDEITESILSDIETFFTRHHAPVFHEVSPLAHASLMPLLIKRGYQPVEFTSVMYLPLQSEHIIKASHAHVATRITARHEFEIWAKTSAAGWRTESEELSDFMLAFGMVSAQCKHGFPYIAEIDHTPIATGMMYIFDDVALLAGASTVPSHRKQGAQSALLTARLHHARGHGCTLAMMCAAPGSQSQQNAEKHGFRIAYTRTKWLLPSSVSN